MRLATTAGKLEIPTLDQRGRLIALTLNIAAAWAIFAVSTRLVFPSGSGASVWFLAAVAHWILLLIAAPYFVPPRDSFGVAVSVILLLVPLDLSQVPATLWGVRRLNDLAILLAAFVGVAAIVAVTLKDSPTSKLAPIAYRLSAMIGRGEVLFTPAIVVSALGFYASQPAWSAAILSFWTIVATVRPAELLVRLVIFLTSSKSVSPNTVAGHVSRVDDPDIVRINLNLDSSNWNPSALDQKRRALVRNAS